jgi:hypothetical protein
MVFPSAQLKRDEQRGGPDARVRVLDGSQHVGRIRDAEVGHDNALQLWRCRGHGPPTERNDGCDMRVGECLAENLAADEAGRAGQPLP